MSRTSHIAALLLIASSAAACAGATTAGPRSVADAEQMRAGMAGKDTSSLAPQAFAAANKELELAKQAQTAGDDTLADLHGDRALAFYNQAIVLARLARANQEDAAATEALARASEQAQRFSAQRKAIDHEADDLEKKLRVAREAQLPSSSGPADPDRERARVVAAQSLVTQARLLCSAARLVSPQAPALGEAEAAVATLEKQVDGAKAALAIDPAARARTACLTSLTKARRATSPTPTLRTLCSQSSQSGDAQSSHRTTDFAPARDERGVVITLRGAFKGDKLSPEAEASLKDLGRVAAAHPAFAVQVVLHDATPPNASETAADQKRGEMIAHTLVEGGAPVAKLKVEQAGARAPVVDPKDARRRDRNARIEVVFVAAGG